MKVSNDILKSVEKLSKLVEETTKLTSKLPSFIDEMVNKVPREQQEEILEFVKESNELLDKSKKLDFNDVQSLINDYKLKYEQGNNNKQTV
jgi:hypothetical protein